MGIFGDDRATEYPTSLFSRRRADLVNIVEQTIYEVKPDNASQRYRGRKQVIQYIKDLGDDWTAGEAFEEFEFDYYGHTVAMRYTGGSRSLWPVCDKRSSGEKNECKNVDLSKAKGLWNSFRTRAEGYNRGADEDRNYKGALCRIGSRTLSMDQSAAPAQYDFRLPLFYKERVKDRDGFQCHENHCSRRSAR